MRRGISHITSGLSLERVPELVTDPLSPFTSCLVSLYTSKTYIHLPRVRITLSLLHHLRTPPTTPPTDYITSALRVPPFFARTGGKKEGTSNEETADVADQQAPVIIRGCGQDGAEGRSTLDEGQNHGGREKH